MGCGWDFLSCVFFYRSDFILFRQPLESQGVAEQENSDKQNPFRLVSASIHPSIPVSVMRIDLILTDWETTHTEGLDLYIPFHSIIYL